MKLYFIILVFLIFSFYDVEGNIKNSPLCVTCKCIVSDNKNIVDCTYLVSAIGPIYNETSYRDMNNSKVLFDYDELNFSGIPFLHLHKVLPASPVKVLHLDNCDLTEIIDEAFKNLQNLTELGLGHNQLSRLMPETFKGIRKDEEDYPLRALRTLRLNNNQLVNLHPDVFEHVEHNLERLYLNGNPLNYSCMQTIQAICSLTPLKVLDLSSTHLVALSFDFFNPFSKLEELYLANNNITNVTTLGLEFAHSLRKLVLNNNPIITLSGATIFPPMKKLKYLGFSYMPDLQVIGNHSLCKLPELEELWISENSKLHTIGINALTRIEAGSETPVIQKLKKLYLNNNKLTHLQLQLEWNKLKDLDINDNALSCEEENQWIVDTLMPIYCKINDIRCKLLFCASPIQMEGKSFYQLHEQKYQMRSLDYYGNHPEMDGVLLVCFLLGLLLGIVVILGVTYAYKRNWFGLFDRSPAAFSRQFYARAHDEEL